MRDGVSFNDPDWAVLAQKLCCLSVSSIQPMVFMLGWVHKTPTLGDGISYLQNSDEAWDSGLSCFIYSFCRRFVSFRT